ncbi:hypothetical protein ABGB12_30570 [Actinocorallia sp. B10E7]|uniref:hypothetical protein n=1 Tax=Actinocorallia sp. B10E7 TaxID=3153558 RepID=UPI00325EFE0B
MTDQHLTEMEGELRTALRLLADDENTAPGADIARARLQGRRAIRNRRLTRIVAPVAVAAVAAAAVGLSLPREADRVAPAQTGDDAQSRWSIPVSFGRLPSRYVGALTKAEEGSYTMVAESSDPQKPLITLTVFHENGEGRPWQWSAEKDVETWAADPVHGRAAHWVTAGQDRSIFDLRFQYAENLWAQLETFQFKATREETLAVLREVADSLDFTERAVALPFRITGLPPDLWTLTTRIIEPHDPARRKVEVSFRHGLRLEITPAGSDRRHRPNTTADGRPAYHFAGTETRLPALSGRRGEAPQHLEEIDGRQERLVGSEVLCVYGVRRFDVCLSTKAQVPIDPTVSIDVVTPGADWASELLKPSGGLLGLFRRMTLIDGPASEWSTTPLPG